MHAHTQTHTNAHTRGMKMVYFNMHMDTQTEWKSHAHNLKKSQIVNINADSQSPIDKHVQKQKHLIKQCDVNVTSVHIIFLTSKHS